MHLRMQGSQGEERALLDEDLKLIARLGNLVTERPAGQTLCHKVC